IIFKNRPVGAIEIFRDITTELQNEAMKDEFISLASHQLRTPLSAIKINSEILATLFGDSLTKQQREAVDAIVSSSKRMAELIDTLLSIARLEAGKQKVRLEYV